MKAKYLIKGIIKNIPGIEFFYKFYNRVGETSNAKYCYAVWLKHLILAHEKGLSSIPEKIAELGPGDSLGVGLSALLSGSTQYYALDALKSCNTDTNLKIFEELVILFKNKTAIPSENEFPNLKPALKNSDFPEYILSEERLQKTLEGNRLDNIRRAIMMLDSTDEKTIQNNMIMYMAPWTDEKIIKPESVDMILSQSVLQHVNDLAGSYESMYKWLKKNGFMSHSIDLSSVGTSDTWDGHWSYSDFEWKIQRGRKNFLLNREPYSTHIKLLDSNNFKIIGNAKTISESNHKTPEKLARRFKGMSAEDLTTECIFIQAIKGA